MPIILLTSANDQDAYLEYIQKERKVIKKKLEDYEDNNYIRIKYEEDISPQTLVRHFHKYRKEIAIFHFSGHASGTHLQLENAHHQESVYAEGLAAWLGEMPKLKLVFLNGCATYGQVEQLLAQGVKAVIATSIAINDHKAADFGIHFYTALSRGETIGQAFINAKNSLKKVNKNTSFSDLNDTRGLRLPPKEIDHFPWGLYRNDDQILTWKLPTQRQFFNFSPQLFTPIPFVNKGEIIGRAEQITEIHEFLHQNKSVLLVNGIGGIGKTAVAKAYISEHQEDYDHLIWLTIPSNNEDALMNAFAYNSGLIRHLQLEEVVKKMPTNDRFTERVFERTREAMRQTSGNNLIILDNVNDKKTLNDHFRLLKNTNWKVILTSRAKSSNYTMIAIDELPMPQAKALFYQFYTIEKNDTLIEELLETIERHTLLTELFAKAAQKAQLSLSNLNQKILRRKKVATGEHGQDLKHRPKEAKVKAYIYYIFKDIAALDEKEQQYLRYFSILPIEEQEPIFLKSIFNIDENTEEQFEDTLEELVEKGWLIQQKNLFRLHPLIKEVVIEYLKPSTENCLSIIENIEKLIYIDEYKDNPFDKFKYLDYGLAVLDSIKEATLAIARLFNEVGVIYEYLAHYNTSASCREKALTIATLKNEVNHIITYQNNLGNVYRHLERYSEATSFLEIALKSAKNNLEKNDPEIVIIQNNLAIVYRYLEKHDEAAKLLEGALKSDLAHFGENHPKVATRRSNLALVYIDMGRYDEALELVEKALKSELNNFGKNHVKVAVGLNSLANIYLFTENYLKAKEAWLENHRILKFYGDNHPYLKSTQQNLKIIELLIAKTPPFDKGFKAFIKKIKT
mgnify:CR=1 FL=1